MRFTVTIEAPEGEAIAPSLRTFHGRLKQWPEPAPAYPLDATADPRADTNPFPVLPILYVLELAKATLPPNKLLRVVDFGGGLGNTYFRCRELFPASEMAVWFVVETEPMVNLSCRYVKGRNLKFGISVPHFPPDAPPDVLILSGVLQYLPNPMGTLWDLVTGLKPRYFVIGRLPVLPEGQGHLSGQRIAGVPHRVPHWFFEPKQFDVPFPYSPLFAGPSWEQYRVGKHTCRFQTHAYRRANP